MDMKRSLAFLGVKDLLRVGVASRRVLQLYIQKRMAASHHSIKSFDEIRKKEPKATSDIT